MFSLKAITRPLLVPVIAVITLSNSHPLLAIEAKGSKYPSEAIAELSINVIASGQFSDETSESIEAIRSPSEYETLRNRLGELADLPKSANINFDEYMILAAFMGEQPTGGHEIRIDSVEFTFNSLRAAVNLVFPGPGCFVSQAVSQPFYIVLVPRVDSEIEFLVSEEEREC